MKAVVLIVTVFMIVFLYGCAENSQFSVPVAPASPGVTEGVYGPPPELSSEKIKTIVIGYDGTKYVTEGNVDFSLTLRQSAYTLETRVNVIITRSGSDDSWTVSGTGFFNGEMFPGEQGSSLVAEIHQFESNNKQEVPYRLYLEYRIDDGGVIINDIKVLTSDAQ